MAEPRGVVPTHDRGAIKPGKAAAPRRAAGQPLLGSRRCRHRIRGRCPRRRGIPPHILAVAETPPPHRNRADGSRSARGSERRRLGWEPLLPRGSTPPRGRRLRLWDRSRPIHQEDGGPAHAQVAPIAKERDQALDERGIQLGTIALLDEQLPLGAVPTARPVFVRPAETKKEGPARRWRAFP